MKSRLECASRSGKAGRETTIDKTQDFSSGSGSISLGSFEPGNNGVRVNVDRILVRNLDFSVA